MNSPMALFLNGGEQARLMLGDQGIDDLVEAPPLQHKVEAVQREADAVIGDASLREIVGADALASGRRCRPGCLRVCDALGFDASSRSSS